MGSKAYFYLTFFLSFRAPSKALGLVLCALITSSVGQIEDLRADDDTDVTKNAYCILSLKRFSQIASIANGIQRSPMVDLADDLSSMDFRFQFFRLQTLLKVYRNAGFHRADERLDNLEDLDRTLAHLQKAEYALLMANHWKRSTRPAERELLEILRENADERIHEFKKIAERLLYLPQSHDPISADRDLIQRILHSAQKFNFHSEDKDRNLVLKNLLEHLEHLQSQRYELDEFAVDLKKYKRALRDILFYFHSFDGLFALTGDPIEPRYQGVTQIQRTKFLELPKNSGIQKPISIPRNLFVALFDAVNELDDLQRLAELQKSLRKAYKKSGLSHSEADAHARDLMTQNGLRDDYLQRAQKIKDSLDGPLESLRKQLKAQLSH